MQLTDWLLVEMALLLIGLNQNFLTKTGFNHPAVIDSHIWLPAQAHLQRRSKLFNKRSTFVDLCANDDSNTLLLPVE
jgi:hypothetical protein